MSGTEGVKTLKYVICRHCGAHLDAGEKCDCERESRSAVYETRSATNFMLGQEKTERRKSSYEKS